MEKVYWWLEKESEFWKDETRNDYGSVTLQLTDRMDDETQELRVNDEAGKTLLLMPDPEISWRGEWIEIKSYMQIHQDYPQTYVRWRAGLLTGLDGFPTSFVTATTIKESKRQLGTVSDASITERRFFRDGRGRLREWEKRLLEHLGADEAEPEWFLVIQSSRERHVIDNYGIKHLLPSMFELEGTTARNRDDVVITVTPYQGPAVAAALGLR